MAEPITWANGAKYFGHYSLGHHMTKAPRAVKIVRVINGLKQGVRVEIPVHCRRCGLVDDADLMRGVCTRSHTPVPAHMTVTGMDAEIASETRASELVQRVVGDAIVWTERGTIA